MTRIAVIGTGWGARVQVPVFRGAGLEVVAIAGHDREKTKKTADELGIEAYPSWRELLGSPVDLVTIVTPPAEHLEMARAALEAGKHVLCEKPTAMNAGEAEELLRAAAANPSRLALIDHELRFLPAWLEAKRRIPSLGGVRYAEIRYASPGRGDRNRAWNWWSDAKQGGGILGAVGSHFADSVRYLIGAIESVQASLNTIINERPLPSPQVPPLPPGEVDTRRERSERRVPGEGRAVTTDDFSVVNVRLTTGAVVTMSLSAAASGPDEPSTITIHCEEGALRLTGEALDFAKRNQPFERIAGNELAKRPGNSSGGAFGSGTYYFGLALRSALDDGDREALSPAATFEDGLAQQRVLDAARRSNENGGRWERV